MQKKVVKKVVKSVKVAAKDIVIPASETTSTNDVVIKSGITKLTTTFPNEDLMKLVEKINEIVDKQNGSI